MNKQESDILNTLLLKPYINQRILAEVSGHSLGVVNRSLKELIKADYLDESIRPTVKAITEFKQKTPQRAVILAADRLSGSRAHEAPAGYYCTDREPYPFHCCST